MTINALTFQELFKDAEALWDKLRSLTHGELETIIDYSGHDILMDIAKDEKVEWDEDIKNLAELLYHQGEVVGVLDVLRVKERGGVFHHGNS